MNHLSFTRHKYYFLLIIIHFISLNFLSTYLHANQSIHKGVKTSKQPSLQEKIGQMLIVDFAGTSPFDNSVQKMRTQMEQGLVSGVLYFTRNIQNREQYIELSTFLHQAKTKYKILFSADLEGGKVNRFKNIEGLFPEQFLSPYEVAQKFKIDSKEKYDYKQIKKYYQDIASKIHDLKINYNFAPSVDLHDSNCPIIGKLGRSFSKSPKEVSAFARVFIQAMKEKHILNCLKHYPGHGRSKEDSHIGFTDVTPFHRADELVPYQLLTRSSEDTKIDSVMISHVIHKKIDSKNPASLSAAHVKHLRQYYNGVIISDDLVMGAILKRHPNYKKALADAIVQSINAGVNILIISSIPPLPKAQKQYGTIKNMVDFFHRTVRKAIKDKKINLQKIDDSFQKIINMKKVLG